MCRSGDLPSSNVGSNSSGLSRFSDIRITVSFRFDSSTTLVMLLLLVSVLLSTIETELLIVDVDQKLLVSKLVDVEDDNDEDDDDDVVAVVVNELVDGLVASFFGSFDDGLSSIS